MMGLTNSLVDKEMKLVIAVLRFQGRESSDQGRWGSDVCSGEQTKRCGQCHSEWIAEVAN